MKEESAKLWIGKAYEESDASKSETGRQWENKI
jgi:hypothetical protein